MNAEISNIWSGTNLARLDGAGGHQPSNGMSPHTMS